MRYAKARYKKETEELAYRIYLTDTLYYKSEGKYIPKRFFDCLHPQPVDNRSAQEIAHDILGRAGIEVKSEDG